MNNNKYFKDGQTIEDVYYNLFGVGGLDTAQVCANILKSGKGDVAWATKYFDDAKRTRHYSDEACIAVNWLLAELQK